MTSVVHRVGRSAEGPTLPLRASSLLVYPYVVELTRADRAVWRCSEHPQPGAKESGSTKLPLAAVSLN